ncbi:MAG: hypothetical protein M1820_002864 [Bogoriella megaspora]|nr:MAG: hypothetical protein M1820_002864 [Bogoriella megaspora]
MSDDMEAAVRTFFTSPRFAVAGASSEPAKFGHKIFVWYLQHSLPATPLNPRASSITALGSEHSTVSTPSALSSVAPPSEFSLSVITPPKITLPLLKEAKEAGIPAVWLQPGTFDDEVLDYARKEFKAAIAGDDQKKSLRGSVGEGWCVLVDGDWGMSLAERKGEKL